MLEDNDHCFRMLSLKAIAELVKYGGFPVTLLEPHNYIQAFADDFRELLCDCPFVTSMVGIIVHRQDPYCKELLDAVGELAKYSTTAWLMEHTDTNHP